MSTQTAIINPRDDSTDSRPSLRWSFGGFESPLMVLHSFEMSERISAPYTLHARLSIDRKHLSRVDSDEIIGRIATVDADFPDKRTHVFEDGSEAEIRQRMFTGIVTRFGQTDERGDHAFFSAEVSPWIWLLSRSTDCRVFQNMTVLEIVSQIFDEYAAGFGHAKYRLQDASELAYLPKRDVCVQFNETDLNFVSRLLEEEGIHYYFEHRVHEHTMVLAATPKIEECLGQRTPKFPIDKPKDGDRIFYLAQDGGVDPG